MKPLQHTEILIEFQIVGISDNPTETGNPEGSIQRIEAGEYECPCCGNLVAESYIRIDVDYPPDLGLGLVRMVFVGEDRDKLVRMITRMR